MSDRIVSPADPVPIANEIQKEIRSGIYNADLLRRLPDAVMPGDRVLVIGGGLGVVSTRVAQFEGVERVIVAEPNAALLPYIGRVHELNGACEVELINAVLAVGKRGKIPYSTLRDPRTSVVFSRSRLSQKQILVPIMDLNLILDEERIDAIICNTPVGPAGLFEQADLGRVDRILLNCAHDTAQCWNEGGIGAQLVKGGYHPEPSGTAILFRRPEQLRKWVRSSCV